jgi:hypothetical protein
MFIDKTRDFHEFLSLILKAFNELPRLKNATIIFLIPNILCPRDDTKYNHKCGEIDFDIMIQRLINLTVR